MRPRGFASDNCSGVHPAVLAAIAAANEGHAPSYGADPWTERLQEVVRREFGSAAVAFPVLTGTGANVVALQAMCSRWGAVVCAASSHIAYDEGGAPEKLGGLKLYQLDTPDGRLTPGLVDREARGFDDVHRARPQVVALTQSTELGTVYRPHELAALCAHAHGLGMRVYLDGARLANAAARLDVPLAALSADVGVDVLSFGGTKNGALLGELVVVLDPAAVSGLDYVRKLSAQLASKLRFVSAQFLALFEDELWRANARHANDAADAVAAQLRGLPGAAIRYPVEANAVFLGLAPEAARALANRVPVQLWDTAGTTVRLMTSFDTSDDDVRTLARAVRESTTREDT
jgi:threonine aldolase